MNRRTIPPTSWKRQLISLLLALLSPLANQLRASDTPNQLTEAEKAAGWRLLFDGKTTDGWRSFKKTTFPQQGWVVEDGVLTKVAGVRGGDIISNDEFTDFDFQWDWKIPPKANNGIKYFITEERN